VPLNFVERLQLLIELRAELLDVFDTQTAAARPDRARSDERAAARCREVEDRRPAASRRHATMVVMRVVPQMLNGCVVQSVHHVVPQM
jgi:hypothetical protein